MAGKSFLRIVSGQLAEILGVQTSAGAGNAGDIPALNAAGAIDITMMPAGIGGNVLSLTSSEAISAGAAINIAVAGTVRNANATDATKPCHGFASAAITSGAAGNCVLGSGINTNASSLTIGAPVYLGTTAGTVTSTAPSTTGNLLQQVGYAVTATTYVFNSNGAGITRA